MASGPPEGPEIAPALWGGFEIAGTGGAAAVVEAGAGVNAGCAKAPGLWDTMSCSPGCRPRLSRGSSGMIVSACGGYPALTIRVGWSNIRVQVANGEQKH